MARRFGDGMFARRGIDAVRSRARMPKKRKVLSYESNRRTSLRRNRTDPRRGLAFSSRLHHGLRSFALGARRAFPGGFPRLGPRFPALRVVTVETIETRDPPRVTPGSSPRAETTSSATSPSRHTAHVVDNRRAPPETTDAASSNRRRASAAAACPASPPIWFSLTLARLAENTNLHLRILHLVRVGTEDTQRGVEVRHSLRRGPGARGCRRGVDGVRGFRRWIWIRRRRTRILGGLARAPATISAAMADRSLRSAAASVDPRVAVAAASARRASASCLRAEAAAILARVNPCSVSACSVSAAAAAATATSARSTAAAIVRAWS